MKPILGLLFFVLFSAPGYAVGLVFFDGTPTNATPVVEAPSGNFVLYTANAESGEATGDLFGREYYVYYPQFDQHAEIFKTVSRNTFQRCTPSGGGSSGSCIEFQVRVTTDLSLDKFQIIDDSGIERLGYDGPIQAVITTTDPRGPVEQRSETIHLNDYNACMSSVEQTRTTAFYFKRTPEVSNDDCRFNHAPGLVAQAEIGSEFVTPFRLEELTEDPIRRATGLLRRDGQSSDIYLRPSGGRQFVPRLYLQRIDAQKILLQVRKAGHGLHDLDITEINLPEPMFDVSLYTNFGAYSINAIFRLQSGRYLHVLIADNFDLEQINKTLGMKILNNFSVQPYQLVDDLRSPQVCSQLYSFSSNCVSNEQL